MRNFLPSKNSEIFDTDEATDLVAIAAEVLIVKADALDKEGRELLLDYYNEVGDSSDEAVFWIGEPCLPKKLVKRFKLFASFDDLENNLKYFLLTAFRKSKRAKAFSEKLIKGIQILSLIRKHPGIKTQELAEQTGSTVRTVQRYISALQAGGEWLEYDRAKKGWALQYGKSVFFGDIFGAD